MSKKKQYKIEFKLHGVIFTSDGIFDHEPPEKMVGIIKKQLPYAVDVRVYSRPIVSANRNPDYKLEEV